MVRVVENSPQTSNSFVSELRQLCIKRIQNKVGWGGGTHQKAPFMLCIMGCGLIWWQEDRELGVLRTYIKVPGRGRCTPVVSDSAGWGQENGEFEASLSCTERLSFRKKGKGPARVCCDPQDPWDREAWQELGVEHPLGDRRDEKRDEELGGGWGGG